MNHAHLLRRRHIYHAIPCLVHRPLTAYHRGSCRIHPQQRPSPRHCRHKRFLNMPCLGKFQHPWIRLVPPSSGTHYPSTRYSCHGYSSVGASLHLANEFDQLRPRHKSCLLSQVHSAVHPFPSNLGSNATSPMDPKQRQREYAPQPLSPFQGQRHLDQHQVVLVELPLTNPQVRHQQLQRHIPLPRVQIQTSALLLLGSQKFR